MFSNLFKKSDKPSAAVFVDYEHWYYGYNNIFSMKPNVQEWYDELTEEYNVKTVIDFRSAAEVKKKPDDIMAGVEYYHIPIRDEDSSGNSFLRSSTFVPILQCAR